MPIEQRFLASHHWEKLMESALLALFFILLYTMVRVIITSRIKDSNLRIGWQKAAGHLILIFATLLMARIWIVAIQPALTFLGIVAAALTLIHKAALMSLTGGLFIVWRGLFSIGDRIQVGVHQGDVIGTGLFYFTLFEVGDAASGHQSTGRILKIPNNLVLTTPLVSHSKFFPQVWHELAIVLLPNSNWVKAKAIFQQLTEKHTKVYEDSAEEAIQNAQKSAAVSPQNSAPKVYVALQQKAPAGIKLTSRFLCEAHAIGETEVLIYEDLLDRLKKEPDIELTFEGLNHEL